MSTQNQGEYIVYWKSSALMHEITVIERIYMYMQKRDHMSWCIIISMVCKDDEPLYLVMELMDGSLTYFLDCNAKICLPSAHWRLLTYIPTASNTVVWQATNWLAMVEGLKWTSLVWKLKTVYGTTCHLKLMVYWQVRLFSGSINGSNYDQKVSCTFWRAGSKDVVNPTWVLCLVIMEVRKA